MNRWIQHSVLGILLVWSTLAAAVDRNALPTQEDRLSYAMGLESGKSFKEHGLKINPSTFSQGLNDGITTGTPTLMTQNEINKELKSLQKKVTAENSKTTPDTDPDTKTVNAQESQTNSQLGRSFLTANKSRPGVVETNSGLQYKILTPGSGPKPTANSTVTVDYEGRLLNGQVFDSSYQRGKPTSFPVNAVIAGWQEALQLMPAGSTWELYIPASLAYGEKGVSGVIAPNETLIFKVHLISVQ